jgi:hypothetical protein
MLRRWSVGGERLAACVVHAGRRSAEPDFRPPRDRAAQPDDERHSNVLEMAAGLSTLAKLDAIWYSRARASTFKVDILRWTGG